MAGESGPGEPCDCGSGRPYARCCRAGDRAAELGWRVIDGGRERASDGERGTWRSSQIPPRIRMLELWEVDVLPVPPGPVGARAPVAPAMALVAAGTYVLHLSLLSRLPREPVEAARVLERVILQAADEVGRFPSSLRLRRPEVARLLDAALDRWQVRCEAAPRLDGLDAVMRTVRGRLAADGMSPESPPESP